jgi:CheY-like chemotaxis protein
LQAQLHGMGYEVTGIAGSEDEALTSIATDRPDLILLGLHPKEDSDDPDAENAARRFNLSEAEGQMAERPAASSCAISAASSIAAATSAAPAGAYGAIHQIPKVVR